eukprot:c18745_g1_i2.p1 GENE.c18745_g1_i2~~c18745_g1_i2.p1  ORF type:complete len:1536 (+),score=408.64 c18745_g1_i2:44-4651(+)
MGRWYNFEFLCSEGAWSGSDFSICFQECYFQPFLLIVLVLLFPFRLATLRRQAGRGLSSTSAPPIQRVNFIAAVIIFGLRVAILAIDAIDVDGHFTKCLKIGDVCAVVAWAVDSSVIFIQGRHGRRAGRAERLWWLLAFAVAGARLRTDITSIKERDASDGIHCTHELCLVATILRLCTFPSYFFLGACGLFQRDTLPAEYKSLSRAPLLDAGSTSYGTEEVELKQTGLKHASLYERLTYSWINPLLKTGSKIALDHNHMNALPPEDTANDSVELLLQGWAKYGQGPHPSFFRAMHHAFGVYFWITGLYKVINDVCVFVGPILLNRVITFLEKSDRPQWEGYVLALAMFLSIEVQSLAMGQYFFRGFRQGLRVRAAICSMVFNKSLKLTYGARANIQIGHIVSLMQIDAQKICDSIPYMHLTWSSPFQLGVALYLLYQQMGVSSFAGVGILVLLMPINAVLARKQAALTRKTMEARDKRIKTINEIMSGIRIVKMFGWENSFMDRINGLRTEELKQVQSNSYWGAASLFLWGGSTLMVSIGTFGLYVALGHQLTASRAFTALALFNVLRFPLNALPDAVTRWIDVGVSNTRLFNFMRADEIVEEVLTAASPVVPSPTPAYLRVTDEGWFETPNARSTIMDRATAVLVNDVTLAWPVVQAAAPARSKVGHGHGGHGHAHGGAAQSSSSDSGSKPKGGVTVLKDINIRVSKGSFVCIVGSVGSGKSTLLDSLLNELRADRGSIWINGRTAYCAQQAWIQNATLKNNVLFGLPFDSDKYATVLDACALRQDLEALPGGDETEIGERGINVSGGQKQRIALARACYSNADVIILDDVLSAVDVHVGQHIVQHCLLKLLKKKTRILATHQTQFLSLADHVIVLKDGKVQAQGKFEQLKAQGIDFGPLDKQQTLPDEVSPAVTASNSNKDEVPKMKLDSAAEQDTKKPAKIIKEEEREKGLVALKIWKTYAAALGLLVFLCTITAYGVAQGLQVASNFWLSVWASNKHHHEATYYLGVYCALSAGALALVYARALAVALASVRAGRRIHAKVIWGLLRSPTQFFDTTPLGRILNRVSQDQQTVDVSMKSNTSMLFNCISMVIGAAVSIVTAAPYVALVFLPVSVAYYRVQNIYRASARELQRLDSISKSPIFVSFSESLQGSVTIRAFDKGEEFIDKNKERIDKNLRAALPAAVSNRWLAIRLEFLGSTIVGFAAALAVFEHSHARHSSGAGLAGLALSYALEVTSILNWLIRTFTAAELQMVSVERLMQWEALEPEAPLSLTGVTPPPNWPARGEVAFKNVVMKYRSDLDNVLKGVSFEIKAGERVGVVGRTGSGKSSLLVCLFRLVELSGGSIVIDGIDISKIGLHDLRKKLSIIPQDPTLFGGTLRSNLDAFNEYTDSELWRALEQCSLRSYVEQREGRLDMVIEPNGANLSVGQRQLVCLGRALLRQSRVLVLDEATASIDGETDALIQRTLTENSQGRTVITIAHRIHTVLSSDKILVMGDGLVEEFDTPEQLMANKTGLFYSLVKSSQSTGALDE